VNVPQSSFLLCFVVVELELVVVVVWLVVVVAVVVNCFAFVIYCSQKWNVVRIYTTNPKDGTLPWRSQN
jgi:hypothetical protein